MHRFAYLPCEFKSRDLRARLLVADYLLKENIPIVLGPMWSLLANAPTAVRGCWLTTTANLIQANGMRYVKKQGFHVVAMDEESLPLFDPLLGVHPEAVAVCHQFLVNSEIHKSALTERYTEHADKFIVTGSPRIEVLSSPDIKAIVGPPFILFATGFGQVNSIWDDDTGLKSTIASVGRERAELLMRGQRAGMKMMKALAIWAIKTQGRVVVRPHPAENVHAWQDIHPEIEISKGSESLPWIKSARVLVHCNSTTGIEAAAMGVPTLNLDPLPEYGDMYMAKRVNRTVKTIQEARNALDGFKRSPPKAFSLDTEVYPPGGAKNIAQVIVETLKDAESRLGTFVWKPCPRSDTQRKKFTVELDEIKKSIKGNVTTLDDSVFLLLP